jgi:hypothetical protein
MTDRLGDGPIQQEYHALMNAAAQGIDKIFNGNNTGADKKTGWVLMVYPYGEAENGRCNYISNGADRRDVVCLMKEMIARFEGQPEISGNA